MIFSETIESIQKLNKIFEENNIPAETVHNQTRTKERKLLLDQWGKEYFPLLSVHTIQRIGRVIRKFEGKNRALIYVNDTKDNNILKLVVKAAIEKKGDTSKELFKEKTILSYFDKDKNENEI